MKRILSLVTALVFSAVLNAPAVVLMTVDENGNGNIDGAPVVPAGFLLQDPGPGGLANALNYPVATAAFSLGTAVAGDVLITEPGAGSTPSDLIRFRPGSLFPSPSPSIVTFYSDNSDGVDSLADIGFPTALNANRVTLPETGVEGGLQVIHYTPLSGQPGYIDDLSNPGHTAITYAFISDVPEPTTTALGGTFLAIAFGLKLWRRAAVRNATR